MFSSSDDYDAMEYTFDHDGTYAKQWFSILTDTIVSPSKEITFNDRNRNRGKVRIATLNTDGTSRDDDDDGNDLYWQRSGYQSNYHDQPNNKLYNRIQYHYSSSVSASLHKWYSSSFEDTTFVQQDIFLGFKNSFISGCKMSSPDFNIESPDTIDGGPVVEYIDGNPNTLISKEPSLDGDLLVR